LAVTLDLGKFPGWPPAIRLLAPGKSFAQYLHCQHCMFENVFMFSTEASLTLKP
jgi:hypothetical protein